jgi:putative transcriptional regulator
MKSLQGHFLVATAHQLDPNFAQAVILVAGHTERAAFGVIVNDPSGKRGRLPRPEPVCFPGTKARLFCGGPVTGPLMALHMKASLGERQLLPGVFFSRKERNVLRLMWRGERQCRIFTSYAGWGSGQLDYDVEQGLWRVVPATPEQIFSDAGDLWGQLSRQASGLQLRTMLNIKHIPADPLLN